MMPSIFGENLFDEFFDDDFPMIPMRSIRNPLYGKNAKNLMKTDVRETDDTYELDDDLPGFKKDEVQLDLKDGYLTISAAKGLDKDQEDKKGKYIRQERYAGACSRSFFVGEGIEPRDVSAKFEDGILRVSLPKQVKKELPRNSTIAIEYKVRLAKNGGMHDESDNFPCVVGHCRCSACDCGYRLPERSGRCFHKHDGDPWHCDAVLWHRGYCDLRHCS